MSLPTQPSPVPDQASLNLSSRRIAYFSMEIALSPVLPTYSGGLGMLAGDTLRSAADTGAPMIAVSLVHRRGYFRQHLDAAGQQTESDVPWAPETTLPSAGGVLAPVLTPLVSDAYGWPWGIGLGGLVCLAGVVLWIGINPEER